MLKEKVAPTLVPAHGVDDEWSLSFRPPEAVYTLLYTSDVEVRVGSWGCGTNVICTAK